MTFINFKKIYMRKKLNMIFLYRSNKILHHYVNLILDQGYNLKCAAENNLETHF